MSFHQPWKQVSPKTWVPLDMSLVGSGERFEKIVEAALEMIRNHPFYKRGNSRKEVAAMRLVVANILKLQRRDRYWVPLGYHRGYGYYKQSRYNPHNIGAKPLIRVIDGLDLCHLVESTTGNFHRKIDGGRNNSKPTKTPKRNRISRLRITTQFDSLIQPFEGLSCHIRSDRKELVRLKDASKSKRLLDYVDDESTNAMRQFLEEYNNVLAHADITLADDRQTISIEEDGRVIDMSSNAYHRVFSKGSFSLGGRFYGPWWQNVPSELRPGIRINRNETVELDYHAHHLSIAYGQQGIDPSMVCEDGDLYEVEGFCREEVKSAWNLSLSCGSEKELKRALQYKLQQEDVYQVDLDFPALVQAIKGKHPQVASYMCSKKGLELQNLDAQIMERVIDKFVRLGIPVLTIHDSIIVEEQHSELGRRFMVEAYQEMGLFGEPRVRLEG